MKQQYLIIVLILSSLLGFSQLNLRNEAFMFVSNEVVFVNNAVNLSEENSKIYLRNEGQLLQGNGTTGNSGIGALSVYQNGNTNQFAYNYWASPVGNPSAANGNEPARVDLIDDATGLTSSADALFSSNHNGISSPLTISRRWLYTFIASDEYAEWNSINESSPIPTGLGFTMKGIGTDPTGSQLYDFRGKPNNGTITAEIAANQYTLIGNPYPSALDALKLIHDPQNVNINAPTTTGVLYYWDQRPTTHFTSDYVGGYATYTISDAGLESFVHATFSAYDSSGNASPLPEAGLKIAQRYIPIGQGFMVEGSAATSSEALVYLKNEHRVFEKESAGYSTFFRATEANSNDFTEENTAYNAWGLNIVPEDYKRFRLNVIFNSEFTRQLLQNFHHSATEAFDYGLEAKLGSTADTEVSWLLNEVPYVIQAHAFDTQLKIPLAIKVASNQPVDFSLFDVQRFDDAQPIYLHDKLTNIYADLTQQNYSINLEAGNYPSRFEITFQQASLAIETVAASQFEVFQNRNSQELVILNPQQKGIQQLSLYDVNGKLILHQANLDTKKRYTLSTENLSAAVYVFSIGLESKQNISKKVIIKN
ncbi:T9SS type A sorting domain-containing protein [Subsaximicrobium wynnwilliamsii]|uniref:T9SS type A sorting domain-containing protein n=1 Tax=Subsaximicrobium wynnwilliamsii TaxID=291179 RepID=A0A5C6ZLL1_9FLAO|nr:T9SS type A sorting domain-containing protein [Subsaximicrobium wynnwilliamsii]TXD85121.1 T9SS type A sorting domain-containing protein [Subsaximicrobium wynnwilliamsii]TXD91164.1 T9SS type A sorting domain-containing protein [Subsaximicrobium wynnwilliamsii]TXE04558.1 T9SS type A sorting domain-containing protein [Subsaximicrobium wynnwilliamsii]